VLVGGIVLLYYRRIKFCLLVTITVTQGVLIALALGYLAIGYLTSQTAFLGSIIVGNGINYSLILMARYMEERRHKGRDVTDAIAVSLSQTWKPTLVAAITTSVSFAVLMITNIRGFSQFGFIGGVGMIVCWMCTYFFLPSWVSISERIWLTKVATVEKPHRDRLFAWIADKCVDRHRSVLKLSIALSIAAVIFSVWYLPNSLEYNFEKMKFKPVKESGERWELEARDRLNSIFSMSTTPAVVLTDRPDQADPVCDVIKEKAGPIGESNLLDDCKTLNSFVPKDQPEKLEVLADMRVLLESSTLKFLTPEQRKEVDKFKDTLDLKEISLADIPSTITTNFEEADGSRGKIVYVYPKPGANLWNGKELIRFANLIREVDLPNGEKIYSSGESVIFADLLKVVVKDGPIASILSFVAVLLVILATFRNMRESVIVMFSLGIGILWLIATLPVLDIKLNFLNFIALPISFGIGVDYAVNIYQRYKQDGRGSIRGVLVHTGGAVLLCSLTTIIGYSVLLTSRSMGLVSFGLVALMGEFTCLAAAIISLPAFITWLEKRRVTKTVKTEETARSGEEGCCA
jgi:predicted RND superfamily exporter protein